MHYLSPSSFHVMQVVVHLRGGAAAAAKICMIRDVEFSKDAALGSGLLLKALQHLYVPVWLISLRYV
jgi:hypothetical protein